MKKSKTEGTYLFQVDIMVQAPSNGAALEHLLGVLNGGGFPDYRIQSGIQLGRTIERALAETADPEPIAIDPARSGSSNPLHDRIQQYIASNRLIRLNINKGRGVRMEMPCRVVHFDPELQLLTVYHVDEKKVYSIQLNEIDDFVE